MAERDQTSEIVERIYDVAVNPLRYEAMLDAWERRLSALRLRAAADAVLPKGGADPGIDDHLDRADVFVQRLLDLQVEPGPAPFDLDVKAGFVVGRDFGVRKVNQAAREALSLAEGDVLERLPLSPEDVAALRDAIDLQASGRAEEPSLRRFTSIRSGRSILFHVSHQTAMQAGHGSVVIRTTELCWPKHLSAAIRDAFGLTTAEVEIVRAMTEGRSLREIADERERSLATVRSQFATILSKTETHSQAELLRLTLGLMDVVGSAPAQDAPRAAPADLAPIPFRSRTTGDGRRYDWIEFGDPEGRPCLFLPHNYGMIRWPSHVEREAHRRRIRVIAPVRAGYGHSSPLPLDIRSYTEATAADLRDLLNDLRVRRAAVMTIGADLRFAMSLATRFPHQVSGILGCSAALPVMSALQYERMGKWHRFIRANARYAPRILPFLVRSGFALARAMGKESFFRSVNAGSPADIRTFSDPAVRAAILMGSDICLGASHSAHDAFARECIDSEVNWAALVRACPAKVHLLHGDQDPHTPGETVRELMLEFPALDVEIVEDAGQLVFFQLWRRALDKLEPLLPA